MYIHTEKFFDAMDNSIRKVGITLVNSVYFGHKLGLISFEAFNEDMESAI